MSSQLSSQNSLNESSHSNDDVDEELKNIFKDFHIMTKDEISEITEKCKTLIIESDESSSQRKWLVRKLVDLRYHMMSSSKSDEKAEINLNGHCFKLLKQHPSKRVFCDFCSNCIWIFQQSYVCGNCCYAAHIKCVRHVERVCSHVVVCEKGKPEIRICPEIGLSMQNYRCAECNILFMNRQCYIEPRKCHYSGLFFCKTCHWNNYSIIPANIIHNWDFEQRPVSRQSLQEINLFYERPVIKLEEINPKLFVFNPKLGATKAKRMQLMEMKRYLDVCKFAVEKKLINSVMGGRRYMIEGTDFYSIYDLVCVENCSLDDYLRTVIVTFRSHVLKCEICKGHGFLCEFCDNKDPIYPFNDGVYKCESCGSCFHRQCISGLRKGCPKCSRLNEKKKKSLEILEEFS